MINLKNAPEGQKEKINCCLECIHQRVTGRKWQFECKPYNDCHQPSIHSESLSEKINVSETKYSFKIKRKYENYKIFNSQTDGGSAIAIAFALPAKAQVTPFTYFNVDCSSTLLSAITLQTKQAVGV